MKRLSVAGTALVLSLAAPCHAGEPAATSAPYDGDWSVLLDCADTRDKSGLVKGYEYTFHVSIVGGKLRGQYGAKGAPASIVYTGEVSADGALELSAVGNTGRSENSVGKVAQGTPYSYTMVGKLEQSRGQAVRRELRPCTASFAKL